MSMSEDAAIIAFHRLADIAQYRSDLYRLFALGFSNPTADFVADLQSGVLLDNLKQSLDAVALNEAQYGSALNRLAELTTEYQALSPSALLTQLRVEYMRLFIGPRNPVVPIYETLHGNPGEDPTESMLIVSSTAVAVEKAYREAGVQMVSHDSPDHLATELEFLVYLCDKEARAWEKDDNAMAKKWRRLQHKFLKDHLEIWGLALFRKTQEHTEEPFYRYFAALAGIFLHTQIGGFQPR